MLKDNLWTEKVSAIHTGDCNPEGDGGKKSSYKARKKRHIKPSKGKKETKNIERQVTEEKTQMTNEPIPQSHS